MEIFRNLTVVLAITTLVACNDVTIEGSWVGVYGVGIASSSGISFVLEYLKTNSPFLRIKLS